MGQPRSQDARWREHHNRTPSVWKGMLMLTHPTLYPDVNMVLEGFSVHAQTILKCHFIGMYLYGSLALGDFDPQGSDIDYIIVTDTLLSEDLVVDLRDMHVRFDASDSRWAGRIEAAYIPQYALGRRTPTTDPYPQIEKGSILVLEPLESGWILQCHTLREQGIVVAGPNPRTLFAPVAPDDMRRVSPAHAVVWLEQARHDPGWLAWLRCRENQAFVVLTLCRMLYTLDSGAVASKVTAARWMQQMEGTRWGMLIQRAMAGQHESGDVHDGDVSDTVALVQYTVDQYVRYQQGRVCDGLDNCG